MRVLSQTTATWRHRSQEARMAVKAFYPFSTLGTLLDLQRRFSLLVGTTFVVILRKAVALLCS